MKRIPLIAYGAICYILFNISFVYLIGFLSDFGVPKGMNDGLIEPIPIAIAINLGLIFLFGFFHSLMARQSFKNWWTRFVSEDAERSTFVLQAAAFLSLAMWQWRPLPQTLWEFDGTPALIAYGLLGLGVVVVLISTFLIDHFELFGLRHIWSAARNEDLPTPRFRTPFLYRLVRHPMQLGIVIMVFATPHMTAGHLLFASAMTAYILIGLRFEERSLVREFGDDYRAYQARVPMLIPNPFYSRFTAHPA